VPTATFGVLYVFFVLSLERRRLLHVNVTAHPCAAWAAQQMIEAVAPDVVAQRVIRDRDGIFGAVFRQAVATARPQSAPGSVLLEFARTALLLLGSDSRVRSPARRRPAPPP